MKDFFVKIYAFIGDKIEDYSVFEYRENEIKKIKKASATKEEFRTALFKELMWHYWSKCEWELLITKTDDGRFILSPWIAHHTDDEPIVDVTDDTTFDWATFYGILSDKYVKEHTTIKFDVYDQLLFRADEIVDYFWNTRLKYERARR